LLFDQANLLARRMQSDQMIEIRDQRSAASNQRADIRHRKTRRFLCDLCASAVKPISDFRLLISGLCVLLLVLCAHVEAQQPTKIPRVGVLSPTVAVGLDPLHQGFRDLGYVKGKNLAIEYRFAEGKLDRLPALVAELVHLKVDVIVAIGGPAVHAAQKATETIPIVMTNAGDPVEQGFVASLARPGGNITGLSSFTTDLAGKRLELLGEIIPKLSRVAVLWHPDAVGSTLAWKESQLAAREQGLQLQSLEVHGREELDGAFRAASKERAQAVVALRSPTVAIERKRIAELAVKNRLPVIYDDAAYVEAGGLMSYGTKQADLYRRAPIYVDKILKGAKPADLPVEQPTKFELVINLNAAKQIGLTIPPNILARADRVIR
jgi:putative ABC transport system substrate-binding protein